MPSFASVSKNSSKCTGFANIPSTPASNAALQSSFDVLAVTAYIGICLLLLSVSNLRIAFVASIVLLAIMSVGYQYNIQYVVAFALLSLFSIMSTASCNSIILFSAGISA